MTTTHTPRAVRNIGTLKSLSGANFTTLQHQQVNHPDHRVMTDTGGHLPCPSNGIMRSTADMDFRRTSIKDIPEGMMAPRTHASPEEINRGPLGRSKWDFEYMEPGNSIATRIWVSPSDKKAFAQECQRIRKIGMGMARYKRLRGYIALDFKVQTSIEEIEISKLSNGEPVLAYHLVFWRVDGTTADPYYRP